MVISHKKTKKKSSKSHSFSLYRERYSKSSTFKFQKRSQQYSGQTNMISIWIQIFLIKLFQNYLLFFYYFKRIVWDKVLSMAKSMALLFKSLWLIRLIRKNSIWKKNFLYIINEAYSVNSGRSRELSLHQPTHSWSHLPKGIWHLSRHKLYSVLFSSFLLAREQTTLLHPQLPLSPHSGLGFVIFLLN